MKKLTFEKLPNAVAEIIEKLVRIEQLLYEIRSEQVTEESNEFFTIQQAAYFLHLSVPTIYSKVSRGEILVMKRSKRLYLSKEELTEYIRGGKILTNQEIEALADKYIASNKAIF